MKRKIAECLNVRINVGNYQHIDFTKYAEEEIEYSNDKERQEKEDSLTNDLIDNIRRSLKSIPDKLGKGVKEAIEVEEAIKKTIPEWLEKDSIPNIANKALKINNQIIGDQKENKDKEEKLEKDVLVETKVEAVGEKTEKTEKTEKVSEEEVKDLFEDEENLPVSTTTNPVSNSDDGFDLFNT